MVSERAVGFISGMLVAVIALLAASVIPRVMVNAILPEPEFIASDGTPMSSKPRVSTTSNAEAKARQDAAWDKPCPFLKTAWVQGLIEPDEMGYVPKKTIQELMDRTRVGRAGFPHDDAYLSKFGTSGVPIARLALNRPADSRIMHHATSEEERKTLMDAFKNCHYRVAHLPLQSSTPGRPSQTSPAHSQPSQPANPAPVHLSHVPGEAAGLAPPRISAPPSRPPTIQSPATA